MTTATKTTTCKSISYFGEPCTLKHGHTKRHTWDSESYRRKRKAAIEAVAAVEAEEAKKAKPAKAKKPTKDETPETTGSDWLPPVPETETSEVIDIMFSFDTTGSMASCIEQVRQNVVKLTERLFKDIPDLRIGIMAHGDYCDAPPEGSGRSSHYGRVSYVTKMLDLSRDVKEITNFVKTTGNTGGGDAPEAYELALHEMRTKASWGNGRSKIIVLIGDEVPHAVGYACNGWHNEIDWKEECYRLNQEGVKIYTVQCYNNGHARSFYQEAATSTDGFHLTLDNFEETLDLIRAVCYKQQSHAALLNFEREITTSGRMTPGMERTLSTLLGREIGEDGAEAEGAKPISEDRFEVLEVHRDMDIRDFIESKGLNFRKGCGYYQFSKSVTIQDHKEIILLETATGNLFGGRESRRILGLPSYGSLTVSPASCAALQDGRYTAFVQSTSVNRKLLKGTKLLFENEEWDG